MARTGLLNTPPPPIKTGSPQEEEPNVTAEEQEQYNLFVTNGMKILHNMSSSKQLVEVIRGDGNPVQGLANALVLIVTKVEDSAKKGGQELTGDVLLHGGTELLEQIVEVAEAAGIHKFTEKQMESALYIAMDQYGQARQGQGALPDNQLRIDMQELQQADQQGNIEEMVPGITEYAENAPKPEPEAGQAPRRA